ncbi:aspartate/glutamate racemase family protein [Nocardioides sp.]|uniref:aspartate/glutamate racemase family protein n=1 Tax=Nocardioides sp. TaxID=35761 RepID=UPI003784D691
MQTIGLVGGMSWESSAVYYEALNQGVEERLGGLSSARTAMVSVDFAEVTALQEQERWDDVAEVLARAARGAELAGADFLVLCTTTFHRVADQVAEAVDIPLLHLADVVADACTAQGVTEVGFLGTTFAMSRSFFTDRIASHGLTVHVPDERHHATLNRVIYDELVHGKVLDSSRRTVVELIDELWDAGAGGVILGCTELEMLVRQADANIPVFPCTTLHVAAALDRALG